MMTSATLPTHISIAFATALAIAPTTAVAGLKVSGDAESIVVEAQNASIEEVLSALSERFNMRYRSSANLQIQITGTYKGILRDVLRRVLAGRGFFVNLKTDVVEVTVFEKALTVSTAVQAQGSQQVNQGPELFAKSREWPMPVPTPGSGTSLPVPVPGTPFLASPPPVHGTADAAPVPIPLPQPSDITMPGLPFSNLTPGNTPPSATSGPFTPSSSVGH
jgi:hypothetical protein